MTANLESVSAKVILCTRATIFDSILGLDGDRLFEDLVGYHDQYGSDSLVADILIPVLRHIGDMWESGKLGIMHEHHASNIIRSVIGTFRRPAFTDDTVIRVVLACPPRELHDLPNYLFSLMLLDRGLAPIILGANTPWKALVAAARSTGCAACVVSGINPRHIRGSAQVLTLLAASTPIFLAGPIAARPVTGVHALPHDWRHAAETVALTVRQHTPQVPHSAEPDPAI